MARLSAKPIVNYQNINSFQYGNQWIIRAGDPQTLYFQIVDLDQATPGVTNQLYFAGAPIKPVPGMQPLRYLLGVGASNQPYGVVVKFPSIDDAKVIQMIATQADPSDSSIWKVALPPAITPGSGQVVFYATEGSATRSFGVIGMISVEYPGNDGSDGTIANSSCGY